MKYRRFGKLDWMASVLGFGIMRLPVRNKQESMIDEAEAMNMVRYAIDKGVNYLDTAYMYHEDQCESFVGRALQDGYREKVRLATKLPSWLVKSAKDFDNFFETQMERLQTSYIDFYLLHSLDGDSWPKLSEFGILKWAEQKIAEGRIKHLGFSFHDEFDVFKEIVDAYDNWTFCQIQYNYMDIEFQAGTKGLTYAADKGLAVVIMEPLRGGLLTRKPPEEVGRILANASVQRSQADLALQWIWNHPEATIVLSGMSTMQQVKENLESAAHAQAGSLSVDELKTIEKIRNAYRKLSPIPCTKCKYCMPCQQGVNIPECLEYYNDFMMYDDLDQARSWYDELEEDERADKCIECKECEDKCPQEIEIVRWLKQTRNLFDPKK